jgi:predicted RNA-binding protein Jag
VKKNKIILTVIKESDGGFSAIGHLGQYHQDLIATQGDTWNELKELALEAVNEYLKHKGKITVSIHEIDFSFDLPSFFDAYPKLDAAALAKQTDVKAHFSDRRVSGNKKAKERQVHRILAAVKQLRSKSPTLPA